MGPSVGDVCSSPSPSQIQVGTLYEWNGKAKTSKAIDILARQTLIIGRSLRSCQIIVDDPKVSKKHLRIYPIIFDQDNPDEVAPLVYAQDISFNGSLWNGRRIDKRTGGVLLSDGDTLEICDHITFTFRGLREGTDPLSEIQLAETKEFQSEYLITGRVLGSGAYGQVHMAVNQRDGTQLACKIVDLTFIKSHLRSLGSSKPGQSQTPAPAADIDPHAQILEVRKWAERRQMTRNINSKLRVYDREVEILQKLWHPNIIGIEEVIKTENTLYIFQALIPAGDLFSYLEFKRGKLHDAETAVIVRQIVIAVDYLHDNNIVHRDLKPDNVLMTSLTSGCRVVLTDFGCARYVPQQTNRMASLMGTFEYTAPEIDRSTIRSKNGYTKSVDLWSLGCVTVVLLTGGSPFQHPDTLSYSRELARECNLERLEATEEWAHVGQRAKDFVRRLLILDESRRMTAKEALMHDWFTNRFHKPIFEQIYQNAIADWKPWSNHYHGFRDSRSSAVEMQNKEVYWGHSSGSQAHVPLSKKDATACVQFGGGRFVLGESEKPQGQESATASGYGSKGRASIHESACAAVAGHPYREKGQTQPAHATPQTNGTFSIQNIDEKTDTKNDASAATFDGRTHGSDILTNQAPMRSLLSTPVRANSPIRLPFSPAAWNKVASSPGLSTKLQQPMGPPSKAHVCGPTQTSGEQPRSMVKLCRPIINKAAQGVSNYHAAAKPNPALNQGSNKKRRADVYELPNDDLFKAPGHPYSRKIQK